MEKMKIMCSKLSSNSSKKIKQSNCKHVAALSASATMQERQGGIK